MGGILANSQVLQPLLRRRQFNHYLIALEFSHECQIVQGAVRSFIGQIYQAENKR
jgi:hypothetical protein